MAETFDLRAAVPASDPLWFRLHLHRRGERVVKVRDLVELQAEIAKLGPRFVGSEAMRVHQCAACETRGPWTAGWGWYGTIADMDDGQPIVKMCSDACFAAAKDRGLIPRNASREPVDD